MKVVQVDGGEPGVEQAEGVYGNICLSASSINSIAVCFTADMSFIPACFFYINWVLNQLKMWLFYIKMWNI